MSVRLFQSNEKLIDNVRKSIAYNIMCANTPGQYGALAAVEYGMEWLHNCVVEYQRKKVKAPQKDYVKWVCRYIGQWVRSIYSPNTRLRETLGRNPGGIKSGCN